MISERWTDKSNWSKWTEGGWTESKRNERKQMTERCCRSEEMMLKVYDSGTSSVLLSRNSRQSEENRKKTKYIFITTKKELRPSRPPKSVTPIRPASRKKTFIISSLFVLHLAELWLDFCLSSWSFFSNHMQAFLLLLMRSLSALLQVTLQVNQLATRQPGILPVLTMIAILK